MSSFGSRSAHNGASFATSPQTPRPSSAPSVGASDAPTLLPALVPLAPELTRAVPPSLWRLFRDRFGPAQCAACSPAAALYVAGSANDALLFAECGPEHAAALGGSLLHTFGPLLPSPGTMQAAAATPEVGTRLRSGTLAQAGHSAHGMSLSTPPSPGPSTRTRSGPAPSPLPCTSGGALGVVQVGAALVRGGALAEAPAEAVVSPTSTDAFGSLSESGQLGRAALSPAAPLPPTAGLHPQQLAALFPAYLAQTLVGRFPSQAALDAAEGLQAFLDEHALHDPAPPETTPALTVVARCCAGLVQQRAVELLLVLLRAVLVWDLADVSVRAALVSNSCRAALAATAAAATAEFADATAAAAPTGSPPKDEAITTFARQAAAIADVWGHVLTSAAPVPVQQAATDWALRLALEGCADHARPADTVAGLCLLRVAIGRVPLPFLAVCPRFLRRVHRAAAVHPIRVVRELAVAATADALACDAAHGCGRREAVAAAVAEGRAACCRHITEAAAGSAPNAVGNAPRLGRIAGAAALLKELLSADVVVPPQAAQRLPTATHGVASTLQPQSTAAASAASAAALRPERSVTAAGAHEVLVAAVLRSGPGGRLNADLLRLVPFLAAPPAWATPVPIGALLAALETLLLGAVHVTPAQRVDAVAVLAELLGNPEAQALFAKRQEPLLRGLLVDPAANVGAAVGLLAAYSLHNNAHPALLGEALHGVVFPDLPGVTAAPKDAALKDTALAMRLLLRQVPTLRQRAAVAVLRHSIHPMAAVVSPELTETAAASTPQPRTQSASSLSQTYRSHSSGHNSSTGLHSRTLSGRTMSQASLPDSASFADRSAAHVAATPDATAEATIAAVAAIDIVAVVAALAPKCDVLTLVHDYHFHLLAGGVNVVRAFLAFAACALDVVRDARGPEDATQHWEAAGAEAHHTAALQGITAVVGKVVASSPAAALRLSALRLLHHPHLAPFLGGAVVLDAVVAATRDDNRRIRHEALQVLCRALPRGPTVARPVLHARLRTVVGDLHDPRHPPKGRHEEDLLETLLVLAPALAQLLPLHTKRIHAVVEKVLRRRARAGPTTAEPTSRACAAAVAVLHHLLTASAEEVRHGHERMRDVVLVAAPLVTPDEHPALLRAALHTLQAVLELHREGGLRELIVRDQPHLVPTCQQLLQQPAIPGQVKLAAMRLVGLFSFVPSAPSAPSAAAVPVAASDAALPVASSEGPTAVEWPAETDPLASVMRRPDDPKPHVTAEVLRHLLPMVEAHQRQSPEGFAAAAMAVTAVLTSELAVAHCLGRFLPRYVTTLITMLPVTSAPKRATAFEQLSALARAAPALMAPYATTLVGAMSAWWARDRATMQHLAELYTHMLQHNISGSEPLRLAAPSFVAAMLAEAVDAAPVPDPRRVELVGLLLAAISTSVRLLGSAVVTTFVPELCSVAAHGHPTPTATAALTTLAEALCVAVPDAHAGVVVHLCLAHIAQARPAPPKRRSLSPRGLPRHPGVPGASATPDAFAALDHEQAAATLQRLGFPAAHAQGIDWAPREAEAVGVLCVLAVRCRAALGTFTATVEADLDARFPSHPAVVTFFRRCLRGDVPLPSLRDAVQAPPRPATPLVEDADGSTPIPVVRVARVRVASPASQYTTQPQSPRGASWSYRNFGSASPPPVIPHAHPVPASLHSPVTPLPPALPEEAPEGPRPEAGPVPRVTQWYTAQRWDAADDWLQWLRFCLKEFMEAAEHPVLDARVQHVVLHHKDLHAPLLPCAFTAYLVRIGHDATEASRALAELEALHKHHDLLPRSVLHALTDTAAAAWECLPQLCPEARFKLDRRLVVKYAAASMNLPLAVQHLEHMFRADHRPAGLSAELARAMHQLYLPVPRQLRERLRLDCRARGASPILGARALLDADDPTDALALLGEARMRPEVPLELRLWLEMRALSDTCHFAEALDALRDAVTSSARLGALKPTDATPSAAAAVGLLGTSPVSRFPSMGGVGGTGDSGGSFGAPASEPSPPRTDEAAAQELHQLLSELWNRDVSDDAAAARHAVAYEAGRACMCMRRWGEMEAAVEFEPENPVRFVRMAAAAISRRCFDEAHAHIASGRSYALKKNLTLKADDPRMAFWTSVCVQGFAELEEGLAALGAPTSVSSRFAAALDARDVSRTATAEESTGIVAVRSLLVPVGRQPRAVHHLVSTLLQEQRPEQAALLLRGSIGLLEAFAGGDEASAAVALSASNQALALRYFDVRHLTDPAAAAAELDHLYGALEAEPIAEHPALPPLKGAMSLLMCEWHRVAWLQGGRQYDAAALMDAFSCAGAAVATPSPHAWHCFAATIFRVVQALGLRLNDDAAAAKQTECKQDMVGALKMALLHAPAPQPAAKDDPPVPDLQQPASPTRPAPHAHDPSPHRDSAAIAVDPHGAHCRERTRTAFDLLALLHIAPGLEVTLLDVPAALWVRVFPFVLAATLLGNRAAEGVLMHVARAYPAAVAPALAAFELSPAVHRVLSTLCTSAAVADTIAEAQAAHEALLFSNAAPPRPVLEPRGPLAVSLAPARRVVSLRVLPLPAHREDVAVAHGGLELDSYPPSPIGQSVPCSALDRRRLGESEPASPAKDRQDTVDDSLFEVVGSLESAPAPAPEYAELEAVFDRHLALLLHDGTVRRVALRSTPSAAMAQDRCEEAAQEMAREAAAAIFAQNLVLEGADDPPLQHCRRDPVGLFDQCTVVVRNAPPPHARTVAGLCHGRARAGAATVHDEGYQHASVADRVLMVQRHWDTARGDEVEAALVDYAASPVAWLAARSRYERELGSWAAVDYVAGTAGHGPDAALIDPVTGVVAHEALDRAFCAAPAAPVPFRLTKVLQHGLALRSPYGGYSAALERGLCRLARASPLLIDLLDMAAAVAPMAAGDVVTATAERITEAGEAVAQCSRVADALIEQATLEPNLVAHSAPWHPEW